MIGGACGRGEQGFTLVELLVVVGLVGVLGIAAMNVVISATRASTYTQDMRTVMDDGRISLDRIRGEIREARRILDVNEDGAWIRFWLDADQDGAMGASEQICYAVGEIGDTDRYELLRWSGATEDCETPGADARVVARTLVEPDGVFHVDTPPPGEDEILGDHTRLVTVQLRLEVREGRGPGVVLVETMIRLRNVS